MGQTYGLSTMIRLAFSGQVKFVLRNSINKKKIRQHYLSLGFSEEDFKLITELLRKSIIKSKVIKCAHRLKNIILGFSELRDLIVA